MRSDLIPENKREQDRNSPMDNWDPESVRKSFEFQAQSAENYANELAARIKHDPRRDSPFTRETHDEHLAKWYVYDSLAVSNCLESRTKLVAEVKRRLSAQFDYRALARFSKEAFEKHWRQYMQLLLTQYEKSETKTGRSLA